MSKFSFKFPRGQLTSYYLSQQLFPMFFLANMARDSMNINVLRLQLFNRLCHIFLATATHDYFGTIKSQSPSNIIPNPEKQTKTLMVHNYHISAGHGPTEFRYQLRIQCQLGFRDHAPKIGLQDGQAATELGNLLTKWPFWLSLGHCISISLHGCIDL